jgi:hypothetical protein
MTARGLVVGSLEVCIYAIGMLAGSLLLWQTAALLLVVTIGPGAPSVELAIRDQARVFQIALSTLPGVLVGAARLRTRRGWLDSSLLVQAGTGLFALALSYRFLALLTFFGMLLSRSAVSDTRRAIGWRLWGATLLVCLAPIDISLRSAVTSPRPRLVATANCASRRDIELNSASQLVCVAGGPWLYSEPRWVVVW